MQINLISTDDVPIKVTLLEPIEDAEGIVEVHGTSSGRNTIKDAKVITFPEDAKLNFGRLIFYKVA